MKPNAVRLAVVGLAAALAQDPHAHHAPTPPAEDPHAHHAPTPPPADPHAGHDAATKPPASPSTLPADPAATLAPDALDRPADSSAKDASRAGGMVHAHGASTYRLVDAATFPDAKASGHGTPASGTAPSADPHAGHDMGHEEHR